MAVYVAFLVLAGGGISASSLPHAAWTALLWLAGIAAAGVGLVFAALSIARIPRQRRNAMYLLFYLPLHYTVPLLALTAAIRSQSGGDTFGYLVLVVFWFFAAAYPARWIATFASLRLLAALIHTARCPGCGEQYPLVEQWMCRCGYHDHRERHAFLFRCPQCRERLGGMNCERCEATIFF